MTPDSRSFTALFMASLSELTDVNGRLLPTLRLLLTRPGALSRAYQAGQWRRYMTPISVFLLANVVFFLAPSLSDFSVTLSDQRDLQPYRQWVAPWIDSTVAASGESFQIFAERYQQRANDVAKTLVILHVPLIALVTLLLFFDKRILYADHVVTAMHFFAFLMLYYAALPHVVAPAVAGIVGLTGLPPSFLRLGVALQFLYVPFMLRRAFGVGWMRAIASTAVYLPALLMVHIVYRFTQLMIVMALI